MKNEERNIWKELELGFGSGSKFRVLTFLVLNHKDTFTKYAIAKATGLKTSSVDSHLRTLLELGWITEYSFTPKTYQVNLENKITAQIREFFQEMRHC